MENFVVVDGLRTRYVEEGSGTTVLLLHGLALGSSLEVYAKSIPILAKAGLRAIAYDLPAFGLTSQPQDYSDEFRTEFILKFMDALRIDKSYMVGHSNAGTGPALIALKNSNRLQGIIALAVFPLLPCSLIKEAEARNSRRIPLPWRRCASLWKETSLTSLSLPMNSFS